MNNATPLIDTRRPFVANAFGSTEGAKLAAKVVASAATRLTEISDRFSKAPPDTQAAIALECTEQLEQCLSTLLSLQMQPSNGGVLGSPHPLLEPSRRLRSSVTEVLRQNKTDMFPTAKGSRGNRKLSLADGHARTMGCIAAMVLKAGGYSRREAYSRAADLLKKQGHIPDNWVWEELEGWQHKELPKHDELVTLEKAYSPLVESINGRTQATMIAEKALLPKIYAE